MTPRAKIFDRETGECQVSIGPGTEYQVHAEQEVWGPTLERWVQWGGVSLAVPDEDDIPELVTVAWEDEQFPQAVKQYVECQFGLWHVEVMAP